MKKQLLATFFIGLSAQPAFAAEECPAASDTANLTKMQNKLSTDLSNNMISNQAVLKLLEGCYGEKRKIPACLQRTYDYVEQRFVQSSGKPMKAENELNMRRPPEELRAPNPNNPEGPPALVLFQKNPYKDAEQIAKEKGWPVVRYKSRHSGGFDTGTSSLMMIYVAGNKRSPPVDYDQYINIALPADPEDLNLNIKPENVAPIPKGKIPTPEQYLDGDTMPGTTTILTVRKGGPSEEPLVLFNKFDRSSGTELFIGGGEYRPVQNCYNCHPNGLRAISPLGYGVSEQDHANGQVIEDEMWKKIREMNATMNLNQRFRLPSWGQVKTPDGKIRPLLNANGIGPVYGPVKPLTRKVITKPDGTKGIEFPTRSKDFIDGPNGCAKEEKLLEVKDIFGRAAGRGNIYRWDDSKPMDWKKVTKAMNCASCHNNEVHGSLNAKTDLSTIMYKVLVDKSMPVLAHRNPAERASASDPAVHDILNMNERIALVNCLRAEFRKESGLTRAWLSEKACKAPAATTAESGSEPNSNGDPASESTAQ